VAAADGRPLGAGPAARYALPMARDIEQRRSRSPVVRRAAAGLVLVAAAALAIHLVIGLVLAVFWGVVVVAVALAVLWALKTIVW